jgi:hypothetical protein
LGERGKFGNTFAHSIIKEAKRRDYNQEERRKATRFPTGRRGYVSRKWIEELTEGAGSDLSSMS